MTVEELMCALQDLCEAGWGNCTVYVSSPLLSAEYPVEDIDTHGDGDIIVIYTL